MPRIKLKYTRAMVKAAISGALNDVEYECDPIFGVNIPKSCPDVPSELLNPSNFWKDKEDYLAAAKKLAKAFSDNLKENGLGVPDYFKAAGLKN